MAITETAEPIRIVVPGRPVPAARMTRRGKWVSRQAQRYLAYKEEVAWAAREVIEEPLEGPVGVRIDVFIAGGKQGDADNYGKSILDSCNMIAYRDDRQVMDCRIVKHRVKRGTEQRAEILLWPLDGRKKCS